MSVDTTGHNCGLQCSIAALHRTRFRDKYTTANGSKRKLPMGNYQWQCQALKCGYVESECEAQRAKSGGILVEGIVSSVPPARGSNSMHFGI